MATIIQVRRDTSANWTTVNPILAEGEQGYDMDVGMFKIGDGISDWNTLAFSGSPIYTEDDPADSNPSGYMNMAVRADTLAAVTDTDGDNIALRSTNKGELYVKQVDTVNVNVTGGSITVGTVEITNDAGNPIPVNATDLDIRNLVFATDKVDVSGSTLGSNSGVDIGDVTINNAVGAPANVQIGDGTLTATVRNTGAADSLNVAITDASGNQITTFGGASEYTEGATDASITGTAILMEGAGDTLLPVQGTVADGLLVNLGANNDVTVTGTVDLGATDNAVLDAIAASVAAIDTDTSTIITSVQLLDDAVYTDGSGTVTKGIAIFGQDGTNPQAIKTDTSGELQIDVLSIAAGDTVIGRIKLTDGTDVADILDLTNSNPLVVAIVDSNGDQITSFGGGTQYTEDAAAAANPVGTVPILIRADTPATQVTTDGDNVAQRGTNYGAAYVQVVSSAGAFVDTFGGGTQYTEGDTDATITGTAMLMEGAANALVVAQGTAADGLLVNLGTNNDVTITGDALTALQLIDDPIIVDDAAFTPATTKVMMVGFEYDDTGTDSVDEGDGGAARMSANRNVYTQIRDAAGNERGLNVDANGAIAALVSGDTAHDSADSGNPVKVGFKAINALPTAVAANDRANAVSDLWGRQLVSHIDPAMQVWKSFNATTQQTGTDVWTPASGKKIAITHIIIGTYGTTTGRLILWFGANADTTYSEGTDQAIFKGSFAPSSTVKPGAVISFATPVFAVTADHEVHCTTDAALSVDISLMGYEF